MTTNYDIEECFRCHTTKGKMHEVVRYWATYEEPEDTDILCDKCYNEEPEQEFSEEELSQYD